jgi:hypothetical protein
MIEVLKINFALECIIHCNLIVFKNSPHHVYFLGGHE